MTRGVLLGRFQEFHFGHLRMMLNILQQCDFLVVCVGSAQIADPFTGEERCALIDKQLDILGFSSERRLVVVMDDPVPIAQWPKRMWEVCGLRPEDENILFRSDDDIPQEQKEALVNLGVKLVVTRREPFYHKCDDGLYWLVASGTEIRRINKALKRV